MISMKKGLKKSLAPAGLEERVLKSAARRLARAIDESLLLDMGILKSFQLVLDTRYVGADRDRYFTVHPRWVPDRTSWHNEDWDNMVAWTVKHFGASPGGALHRHQMGARWYTLNQRFWFKDRRDFQTFILRWSSL